MTEISNFASILSEYEETSTKSLILNATCELVAQKGIQGTTVRDITAASGANVAAVNYHFQSKDALISLATRRITEAVNLEREKRLDGFLEESQGKPLTGQHILRALIEPIAYVSRAEDGGSLYARVSSQLRTLRHVEENQQHFQIFNGTAQRFITEMARSFPDLTRAELIEHYEFARGAGLHMAMAFDPAFRRIERLLADAQTPLPAAPHFQIDLVTLGRTIAMVEHSFGKKM